MPTIPNLVKFDASTTQILNAIRNESGGFYQSIVPIADGSTGNLRQIGTAIMGDSNVQNAFLSALINRIGRVILTSKTYENPWAFFKKGMLEYGETVEEIFVNIAKPFKFNPATAESEVFKREIPDVKAEFHPMNYQTFYKVTVSNDQLRQAFLSASGITDLIGKIIDSLYTGANYDEFLTMKYLVGRMALSGRIKVVPITMPTDKDSAENLATTFREYSNKLEYLTSNYNYAKVKNDTKKQDQYLINDSQLDAIMSVKVLANAFNMEQAEFLGHQVGVDSFGEMDTERMTILFGSDPTFIPFTAQELATLSTIKSVLVDKDWFMVFDNFMNMTEQYNGQGLYWNYWYHVWKTFSVSPFANAVLFATGSQGVTSVTVSPSTATVKKGEPLQAVATVTTSGLASKQVTWSIAGQAKNSTVSSTGLIQIASDETATSITVTATSISDPTKKANCVITVTA